MPIYDFKCKECGNISEILIRSADRQEISCPECEGSMERLISSSYLVRMGNSPSGTTCCGRAERCETPPCSTGERCHRH
ncbi:FmdB family zinc ribbon protein [Chloroflexota bacterium]